METFYLGVRISAMKTKKKVVSRGHQAGFMQSEDMERVSLSSEVGTTPESIAVRAD